MRRSFAGGTNAGNQVFGQGVFELIGDRKASGRGMYSKACERVVEGLKLKMY